MCLHLPKGSWSQPGVQVPLACGVSYWGHWGVCATHWSGWGSQPQSLGWEPCVPWETAIGGFSVHEGLSTSGWSGTTGHSPCAWFCLLGVQLSVTAPNCVCMGCHSLANLKLDQPVSRGPWVWAGVLGREGVSAGTWVDPQEHGACGMSVSVRVLAASTELDKPAVGRPVRGVRGPQNAGWLNMQMEKQQPHPLAWAGDPWHTGLGSSTQERESLGPKLLEMAATCPLASTSVLCSENSFHTH